MRPFWSTEGQAPYSFVVGVGQVVPGWDEACLDMAKGEKARITVPSSKAYGSSGYESFGIPPNCDLVFEIEMLSFDGDTSGAPSTEKESDPSTSQGPKSGKPGKEKYASSRAVLRGKPKVRACRWASARQELVSGNRDGTVTFWDARKAEPIYVMSAHQSDITQLFWIDKAQILVTSSKDKKVKFWKLPEEWRDKNVVEKEEREYIMQKQTESMIRFKKQQEKAELDSDEDDLAGWQN